MCSLVMAEAEFEEELQSISKDLTIVMLVRDHSTLLNAFSVSREIIMLVYDYNG